MKYKGGRIPIGKSTRIINPKTLYKRKREERTWTTEHEVVYAAYEEGKEDQGSYGEGV
jgi:hypothetical protein